MKPNFTAFNICALVIVDNAAQPIKSAHGTTEMDDDVGANRSSQGKAAQAAIVDGTGERLNASCVCA